MTISRDIPSHWFLLNSVPYMTKNQRAVTAICRFLNIFQTIIVIAPVMDDTLNVSKKFNFNLFNSDVIIIL